MTAPLWVVETDRLGYAYRKEDANLALDGVDLRIAPGEYLLVCGASGSGKSTLCRTFNGLIPHFYGGRLHGDVRVAGKSTAEQSVAGLFERVGMVFQNPETQLFNSSVAREIAFGLESLGLPRADIQKRIFATAQILNLSELLERNPRNCQVENSNWRPLQPCWLSVPNCWCWPKDQERPGRSTGQRDPSGAGMVGPAALPGVFGTDLDSGVSDGRGAGRSHGGERIRPTGANLPQRLPDAEP